MLTPPPLLPTPLPPLVQAEEDKRKEEEAERTKVGERDVMMT